MKLYNCFFIGIFALVGLTGCGTLEQPTPLQMNKNKNIRVYVDESADIARSKAFIDEYIKVLNDGFETRKKYEFRECSLVPIKNTRMRQYRNFNTIFDKNYITVCKKSKLLSKNKMKLVMKAKKISNNSIEIETDGTLSDIISKQIALKTVGFDRNAYKRLLPFGYMDFNIDTLALKDNRLVLNFYSKEMNIKDIYIKQLRNRGYTIVDNYKDADKAIFIENIMALPKTFSERLINYYKRNKEKYLMKEISNINALTSKIYSINGNTDATTDELSRLATMRATGTTGVLFGAEVGFYLTGVLLDSLGPDNKDLTSLGYKIIIENKRYDKNSKSVIDKYRYRAAIYFRDKLYTHSSISVIHNYLEQDKYKNQGFAYDIINYFDNDEVRYNMYLLKADYDDINKKYM